MKNKIRRNGITSHQDNYETDEEYYNKYREQDSDRKFRSYESRSGRGYYNRSGPYHEDYLSEAEFMDREEYYGALNPYGEHPDSLGYEEYYGSNKRHPGLGNYPGSRNSELWEQDRMDYNADKVYYAKEDNRKYDRKNSDLELNDYMNRDQYKIPFRHGENYDLAKVAFDREESENYLRRERLYQQEGYQTPGNTEGFGIRGSKQQGHDWREEDDYREGHAPRYRGMGKYGSR